MEIDKIVVGNTWLSFIFFVFKMKIKNVVRTTLIGKRHIWYCWYCLVPLDHPRDAHTDWDPHGLEYFPEVLNRTSEIIQHDFHENTVDSLNGNDLHKNILIKNATSSRISSVFSSQYSGLQLGCYLNALGVIWRHH